MTIATYAGIPLEGQSPITWAMTTGVTPYVTSITVSNGTAAAIAKVMEGKMKWPRGGRASRHRST